MGNSIFYNSGQVEISMAKGSRYWKDRLDKAEKDLERVEKRLEIGDGKK